jgi:anti-anti-sigma factor
MDAVAAPKVEQDLLDVVARGAEFLICDFSDTVYVSSAGLRVMLLLTKKQRALGRRMVLACMKSEVSEIFRMAGFDAIMEIVDAIPDVCTDI